MSKRAFLKHCWFILLFSIAPSIVFAQKETGAISGVISDAEGRPMPGVNVTASSTSLIGGFRTAFTDQSGYYGYPALPPGSYEIKVELSGFQAVVRSEIRLYVGRSLTIDFTLQMTKVSETIEVSGHAPLIDSSSPASSKAIPAEVFDNFPRPLNPIRYIDMMSLTPGVGDLDLVAYGAEGEAANGYWIDGVNVASPRSGQLFVDVDYNWIQEAEVVGIGAPAEYGGFTGVVGNFITRSGGNQFHGLLETFFENQALVSENTPQPNSEIPFKIFSTTAQIGGPIRRDKLWFFAGFGNFYSNVQPFNFNGSTIEHDPKAIFKLTYKINQNNTLQGFGQWGDRRLSNELFILPGFINTYLPEAAFKDDDKEATWNVSWSSVLSEHTFLEAKFAGWWTSSNTLPKNGNKPGFIDGNTGIASNNGFFFDRRHRTRPQANVSLTQYADHFLKGHHEFKFGMELERSTTQEVYGLSGGLYYYNYGGYMYRVLYAGFDLKDEIHRTSLYAQDAWNVSNRVNLSLGVRLDHNRGITGKGPVYTTTPVAPRVGMTYDINGNNRTILKAHYGDYHLGFFDRAFAEDNDFPARTTQFFDSDTGEWQNTGSPQASRSFSVDADIKQPFVRQFTVGVDRELPADIAFGAHYIYRRWHNILEDINTSGSYEQIAFLNPLTQQIITVFNRIDQDKDVFVLTNPDSLFRRYDALELSATRNFSKNFYLSASMVISKIKGNVDNTTDSLNGNSRLFNDPNFQININGSPRNDPTYEIKVLGIYKLRWGINTTGYFRHFSGDTWTPLVVVPNLNQRAGGGKIRIFALPRGAERLPSRNIVDLHIEKQFLLPHGSLGGTIDLLNVFNTGYVTDVNPDFGPLFEKPLAFTLPREIRLGLRYSF